MKTRPFSTGIVKTLKIGDALNIDIIGQGFMRASFVSFHKDENGHLIVVVKCSKGKEHILKEKDALLTYDSRVLFLAT